MNIPASSRRLDIADVRRRLGNNDALIADLLEMFLETLPTQLADVKTALSTRELDAIRRSAHTLKGSAGNLSAIGIVAAARAVEEAAERGNAADLERLCTRLEHEVNVFVDELTGTP